MNILNQAFPFWRTLRFRFAAWISLFLLLVLMSFSLFVYRSLEQSLSNSLDDSLRLNASQIARIVEVQNSNFQSLPNEAVSIPLQDRSMTVRVVNIKGEVVYATGIYQQIDSRTLDGQETFSTVVDPFDHEDWVRVYTAPLMKNDEVIGFVETAQSLDSIDDTLEKLLTLLQIGVPAFVLLVGIGGYWLAGRALAPIDRVTETARRISAEDLSTRLDLTSANDEVGRLASTFNMMLSRLEDAFRREQQFTSDASHELRTPLAALRTITEMTLARHRSDTEYKQALTDILEEIIRMQGLVEDLLSLARHNTYQLNELIDLSSLLQDVTESMSPLAGARDLTLVCRISGTLMVNGDRGALIRLFTNLIDNAIKYTQNGGIEVTAAIKQDERITITIADTGCGISQHHLPHIFDRFYRADPSRSTTGTGLGLTIARIITQAHGGNIQIESVKHQGTKVWVSLPAAKTV